MLTTTTDVPCTYISAIFHTLGPASSISVMKRPVEEAVNLPLRDYKVIFLSGYHFLSDSPVLFPCHRRHRSLNYVAFRNSMVDQRSN
jgi:hypothetical protein